MDVVMLHGLEDPLRVFLFVCSAYNLSLLASVITLLLYLFS